MNKSLNEQKRELRKRAKEVKRSLSEDYKLLAATEIFSKIEKSPLFSLASSILLYHSLPDEVDTHAIIRRWSAEKTVYLPIVDGDDMFLAKYKGDSSLSTGAFNILEPNEADAISDEEISNIDLAIIPAVALSSTGIRLGRGKGYYDRFLCDKSFIKIGVVYNAVLFEDIPFDAYDIPMDYVVTEEIFKSMK